MITIIPIINGDDGNHDSDIEDDYGDHGDDS